MAKTMTFEEAMQKLEEIVRTLENGEKSLEESLKLFEEGTKLSAFCYEKLQKAEQKITELTKLEEEDAGLESK